MHFYGWSADYVRKGITGAQGWAYLAFAVEHESATTGSGLVKVTPGYVRQEFDKLWTAS